MNSNIKCILILRWLMCSKFDRRVFFSWCRIAISERSHKEGRHDARPQLRNIFTQEGLASIIPT